jgi:hypothetical protein
MTGVPCMSEVMDLEWLYSFLYIAFESMKNAVSYCTNETVCSQCSHLA